MFYSAWAGLFSVRRFSKIDTTNAAFDAVWFDAPITQRFTPCVDKNCACLLCLRFKSNAIIVDLVR